MVYDKTKVHTIIFIMCIFFYIVSPDKSYPVRMEEVSAKEIETTSGSVQSWVVSQIQARGKDDWKKKQELHTKKSRQILVECDADCKINTLSWIGIRPEIAESLVINCKALAEDPVNCIKIWAFIVKNESGGGYNCKTSNKYNCFWLWVQENYKSYNDGVLHWVWKYSKFWFRQKTPDSFYSNSPNRVPVTWYCKSEYQPDWTHLDYCPNWHRIAWSVYNKLNW